MPTGYTTKLYEGKLQTFKEFALSCAHAFGALIDLRDDPLDKPIPEEFKPNEYYVKTLATAQKELVDINGWSEDQAELEAQLYYEEEIARYNKTVKEKNDLRHRYEAMLQEVYSWTVPTEDHQGLKDYMIQQLKSSIDFDCSLKYYNLPQRKSGKQFKEEKSESRKNTIGYTTKNLQEEVERTTRNTKWVNDLRNSLK